MSSGGDLFTVADREYEALNKHPLICLLTIRPSICCIHFIYCLFSFL